MVVICIKINDFEALHIFYSLLHCYFRKYLRAKYNVYC